MIPRIKVYTAISGGFEPDRDDITVFSDYDRFKSARLNAKITKILPHLFMPNDITIWLDGNIKFSPDVDIARFVEEFLGDSDIAVFRHPYRENVFAEARVCIQDMLDDPQVITEQMCYYDVHDYVSTSLAECGVIVRRNNARVNAFNEAWWAQVCAFSSRDQLSFPWVCHTHPDVRVKLNEGNVRQDSRFIYRTRQSSKA